MGYSTDIDKLQHTFHMVFSYYFGILDLLKLQSKKFDSRSHQGQPALRHPGSMVHRTNSVWRFLRQRRRKIHSKDFEGIWLSFLHVLAEYSQNHPKLVCSTSRQKKTFRISWGVTWSNHSRFRYECNIECPSISMVLSDTWYWHQTYHTTSARWRQTVSLRGRETPKLYSTLKPHMEHENQHPGHLGKKTGVIILPTQTRHY